MSDCRIDGDVRIHSKWPILKSRVTLNCRLHNGSVDVSESIWMSPSKHCNLPRQYSVTNDDNSNYSRKAQAASEVRVESSLTSKFEFPSASFPW